MAVALNDRDKAWHDIYRIDIRTGERELLYENSKELAEIVLDRQLRPQLAIKPRDKEGGHIIYRVAGANLEPIGVVEHEDDLTTHPIGFTQDASTLYWISSVGRDKAGLLARDWQTGTERFLPSTLRPTSAGDDESANARCRGGRRAAYEGRLDPAR